LRRGCTRLTLQKDTVVLDAYIYWYIALTLMNLVS
jgi:hypothetical protein